MRISPHSAAFVVFCAALMALPSLSIDIGLPAFPAVAQAFAVDPSRMALTLTFFFVGFAIGPLVYGPASDHFGRRPILIGGCAIYAAGGLFCTIATSLTAMLWWRLVQGIGAGAGSVLALTLVRDHFSGSRARVLYSQIAVVRVVSPMIAPTLGALLLEIAGWRWIYGCMAVGGTALLVAVVLGLEESAPRFTSTDHVSGSVWAGYKAVLGNPACCGNMAALAFGFGSHFAYVTGSSLTMLDVFGLSTHAYALFFAGGAGGLMLASYLSGKLNARGIRGARLVRFGLALAVASTLTMLLLTATGLAGAATIIPFLILNTFCFGLVMPNAQQAVLQPVPAMAGSASALINATMMGMGAFASYVVEAVSHHGALYAMVGTMAAFSAAALIVFVVTAAFATGAPEDQSRSFGTIK